MYDLPGIKLHKWQEDCLTAWFCCGGRGIADVATGAGKTVLALAAIHRLRFQPGSGHPGAQIKVKIIVPKVFLARQWQADIMQTLHIPASDIGLYYGGMKGPANKPFMVYVLNSARGSIARHILRDMAAGDSVFLICDECHHFGSPANAHVFDFLPFVKNGQGQGLGHGQRRQGRGQEQEQGQYFAMGLSATPETYDISETDSIIKHALGPVIFRYNLNDAMRDHITAGYEVFQITVDFTPDEQSDYAWRSDQIAMLWNRLVNYYPPVRRAAGDTLNGLLLKLAHRPDKIGETASALRIQYIRRKEIVHTAQSRIYCSVEIMRRLLPGTRTILFTERIKTADAIYAELNKMYPARIARYHSRMDKAEKARALESYRSGETLAIVCCRALDEGLNVPETDAGVIVSVGNSYRQRIQRIGRLVRLGTTESPKKIYYLNIPDTSESPDILPLFAEHRSGIHNKNQMKIHQLSYLQTVNVIKNFEYDEYAEQVISAIKSEGATDKQLANLAKQLKRGSVSTESGLSEEECLLRLKSAKHNEKEYLSAMLLLIRIRDRNAAINSS
jgi:superfamily II DNA or RNA helicase